jgi:hypothetical protein
VIDSEFLSNLVDIKKTPKQIEDEENKMKCYPKKSNKAPYQKIEFQIRKDTHWPPITPNVDDNPTKVMAANGEAKHTAEINNNSIVVNSKEETSHKLHNLLSRNLSSSSSKKKPRFDDSIEMKYFDEFTKI